MSTRTSLSALRPVGLVVLLGIGGLAGTSFALPVDGDLDVRYGVGGVARSPDRDRAIYDLPVALACGPTGFCSLAAGQYIPDQDFSGSRYGSGGSFEGDFGTHFDLGDSLDDHPYATAVQRDGKVIQVGYATDSATVGDSFQAAIVRYSSNFVPDPSFSLNGKDNYNHPGDISSRAVAIAPDDKIVVTGCLQTGGSLGFEIFVLRYTTAGVLDSTFAGDGYRIFGFNLGGDNYDCAYAVLVQPDGKIVVAGSTRYAAGDIDFAIARLLPDGTLDPTFTDLLSGDGRSRVAFDLGGAFEGANSVALDGRGRIVVGGDAENAEENYRTAIARLLPNGRLDTAAGSFGTAGKYAPDDSRSGVIGIAVAGPPSNRIYYLTYLEWIGALTGAGAIDLGFQDDGFLQFEDPLPGISFRGAEALAFSGGMLHVGAFSAAGANDYDIVARYWMHQIFGDGFEAGNTGAWLGW